MPKEEVANKSENGAKNAFPKQEEKAELRIVRKIRILGEYVRQGYRLIWIGKDEGLKLKILLETEGIDFKEDSVRRAYEKLSVASLSKYLKVKMNKVKLYISLIHYAAKRDLLRQNYIGGLVGVFRGMQRVDELLVLRLDELEILEKFDLKSGTGGSGDKNC